MEGWITCNNLREVPDGKRGMYSAATWRAIELFDLLTRKPLEDAAIEVFGTVAIHRDCDKPVRLTLRIVDDLVVYTYTVGIGIRMWLVYDAKAPLLYVTDESLTVALTIQETDYEHATVVFDRRGSSDGAAVSEEQTWLSKLREQGTSEAANRFEILLYAISH